MKKILVPTDFSAYAGFALQLAKQLAEKNVYEITLLHVIDLAGFIDFSAAGNSYTMLGAGAGLGFDETMMDNLMETAREKMHEFTEEHMPGSDVAICRKIEFGNAYQVILNESKTRNIDLIVIGSKGTGGLEEFLVGSTTEKVVRHAKCPVLTVKRPVQLKEIQEIVFASDFKEAKECIASELATIQKTFGAKVHLLRVNTPNDFLSSRESKKLIRDFIEEHSLENITINIYDDHVEEEGIIHFAQDMEAGMIALATHGRSGLMHLLSGSIAEDVVSNAKRPVWTFKIKYN
ncbi:MAG: universal stress protein [Cyclobacteriaceae bacterium]|nr:universal stress protein [Cyclobacteriaceae bacterium]